MNREKEIFEEALDLASVGERVAFLKGACGADAAMLERLLGLLQASEGADGFLPEAPQAAEAVKLNLPEKADEVIGSRIGHYKLLQKVGEGGCGVVYMAEQEQPVRRRVALKVIKLGMDTRSVVARFEAERQALAMMDHPNIARVLDAGTTEKGRPFFVMELVRGIRITDYCDENNLTTKARLELFISVCQAVQHAHQKGIIHRDLKPSNILVTLHDGVPVPKVIDFGIAKAIEQKLTDKTLFTELHQFMGTPAYMSPEQAEMSGLDIDTRSDIYALGVLLYELLTGKTPFDGKELMQSGVDAIRRTIREVEPPRPSTRLSTMVNADLTLVAKRRGAEPSKFSGLVRGDLDWIVMTCLEKDRTRRYDTANGLVMDIQRHLHNEPIQACPPSTVYRLQKLMRRNKLAVAAGTAIAASLLIGLTASVWQAVRATRERDAKEFARQDAEAISKFLTEVFQSPDPERDGYKITVAETLDKAAAKLDTDRAIPPGRRALLQETLGNTYYALGLSRQSVVMREQVKDYYIATFGREHPGTLWAMTYLANVYDLVGRQDEALKVREEVLPLFRKVLGPEHSSTLSAMHTLANSYASTGRAAEALKLREEVMPLRHKVDGPKHPHTLMAMASLAYSYHDAGREEEALKLREEVLTLRRKVLGPENPDTLLAMDSLAYSYHDAGRKEEALRLREEVLVLSRKVKGPEHPDTLRVMLGLAISYFDAGRREEALQLREEVLTLHRKGVNGSEHPDSVWAMACLAYSYYMAGRKEEALQLREEVVPLYRKVRGPQHPDTLHEVSSLATSYFEAGRRAEALQLREELLALRRKVRGPEHPDTLRTIVSLAEAYEAGENYAKAEPLRSELLTRARKSADTDPSQLEARLGDLAELLYRQRRYADAEALYRERIESCLRQPGAETSDTFLHSRASLGRLYSDWAWAGRTTNAAAAHQRAIEGEKLMREAIAARERDPKYSAWRKSDLQSRLGGALCVVVFTDPGLTVGTREPKLVEAEAILQRGQAGMDQFKDREPKCRRDGIERLLRLYEAWPRPDRLAEWKQKLAAFDAAEAKKNKPPSHETEPRKTSVSTGAEEARK